MEAWKAIMFTTLFWKKIWTWFKNYWYFPIAIVTGLFLMLLSRGTNDKAFKLLEKQEDRYKKEIKAIKENNAKTNREKEKAVQANEEKLREIEMQHNIKIKELESHKEQELQKAIRDFEDNPQEMAKKIAAILEANVVER